MPLEITIGSPIVTVNQGHTVLSSEPDGQILSGTDKGLFFFDTRMVSFYQILANGTPFKLLNAGAVYYYASRTVLSNDKIETEKGPIAPQTLGLTLSRAVHGGVHEDIDITNYGMSPARFNLEIVIRSDFADLFEVKSGKIVRRGRMETNWDRDTQTLSTSYDNQSFRRRISVQARNNDSPCAHANGRITFDVDLAPGGTWHSCMFYTLYDDDAAWSPPDRCMAHDDGSELGSALREWTDTVLKVRTGNEEFYRLYRQSVVDMASLRLPIGPSDGRGFVPAAGVPWFVALFGRDSIVAALQNVFVYPDFARGTLEVLGRYQATEVDDHRDAEPGKILHELRNGELARLHLVPHAPYYGTADATILYVVLLHVAWRSTGDDVLLDKHLGTAERCLEWIDRYGDRDGDGFQEYQTRSNVGYENMGWKDAGDAVLYEDGSPVRGPKALCELQGYVYDAWCRMADVYDHLRRPDDAGRLRRKASHLFRRFNEAFWDEAGGFYAYCLDGDKRAVLTVASNPGHLLWSGIVPTDRAARVVARLMAPDMWSGWGIRTLSSDHPAFNPFSYQNGSVWPHDNGLVAVGMKYYGFHEEATQVARGISEAGSYFAMHQMPELYAGLARTGSNFPVQYPGANVPQAWAAGTSFALLQAIVGFQPDAPNGMLLLDPWLPDWMPDLTLTDLRVGKWTFDLKFERRDGETSIEVQRGPAERVIRQPIVEVRAALACDRTSLNDYLDIAGRR